MSTNKIYLIGESFNINSGQGIYKASGKIYQALKKTENVELIEIGNQTNFFKKIINNTIRCSIKVLGKSIKIN
jgi:hypothetical protein